MATDLSRSARRSRAHQSTRERILDAALELFAERGYGDASLREIAERLGITKAALYYHFERKEDILRELHRRLSTVGEAVFDQFTALPDDQARVRAWPQLVDEFITEIAANRKLMLLAQRNDSALRELRESGHHGTEQETAQQQLLRLTSNPSIPLTDRVRISCSVGAIMAGLIGNKAFRNDDPDKVTDELRQVVSDLLSPAVRPSEPRQT